MSRAKRRQLAIGEWVGEFPIVNLRGAWITIGDWRQCKRPAIGVLYLVELAIEPPRPSYLEILTRGTQATIGKYASTAERRALLTGERIENGEH
jgi:hypothetical protein